MSKPMWHAPTCQVFGHSLADGPATERITVTTTGPADSLDSISGVYVVSPSLTLDVCETCKARILADDPRREITFTAAIW